MCNVESVQKKTSLGKHRARQNLYQLPLLRRKKTFSKLWITCLLLELYMVIFKLCLRFIFFFNSDWIIKEYSIVGSWSSTVICFSQIGKSRLLLCHDPMRVFPSSSLKFWLTDSIPQDWSSEKFIATKKRMGPHTLKIMWTISRFLLWKHLA